MYIIGNGFDIYHGLPTSYRCFLCYMLKHYPEEAKRLGFIFDRENPDKLWSNFEEELETFDAFELVRNNFDTLVNTTENDFYNIFFDIHSKLQMYFSDWVKQINMEMDNGKRLALDKKAFFLNFNYTNTLERFYQINPSQICHIHLEAKENECALPVVGHSRMNNCVEKSKCKICQFIRHSGKYPSWTHSAENFAEKVIEQLNHLWDGLAKEPQILQVNSKEIYTIAQYGKNFTDYCNLDDIYVLGHSLGIADKDYFRKIHRLSSAAKWHLSKYNENDSDLKKNLSELTDIDVNMLNVETFSMNELN